MASIFLIVEGQTEERFYKDLFANSFPQHYFYVVVMPNKKNAYRRKEKGGSVSYELCIKNIKRFFNSSSHCEKIILIYDYYGLHDSFREHFDGSETTLDNKITSIRNRLESEINSPKFSFVLQVHEFEALMFSQPEKIAEQFDKPHITKELNKILTNFNNNPELINNSSDTSPSRRIISFFPQYEFGKTTDGISIVTNIGIPKIRQMCSYFNKFCDYINGLPAN